MLRIKKVFSEDSSTFLNLKMMSLHVIAYTGFLLANIPEFIKLALEYKHEQND